MLNITTALEQAATLLDGATRHGLDQDDLPDRALFALHETTEIQHDLMRLAGLSWLPLGDLHEPAPALTQAADLLHQAVLDLAPGQQLTILGYELRLRRLADQVTP